MPTCQTCGDEVLIGYYHTTKDKRGQQRRETVMLDPHRQTFAPYYDTDIASDEEVRLFWSNAKPEHVCRKVKNAGATETPTPAHEEHIHG